MEYCDSGSLADLVAKRGGPRPWELACQLVLQALEGLDYAHHAEVPFVKLNTGGIGRGRGLVQRDISPQNILLGGPGVRRSAKLADFGLSKAFDWAGLSNTKTGFAAGKPWFMPRQQRLWFKYAEPEVDVWAMAATLYYLLTGCFPRDFPKHRDPWKVLLDSRPIPILQRGAPLPPRLAELIDLALVDQPEILIKTAADLKLRLEQAL